MEQATESRALLWARLRLSIIGPLLAAPPEPGELRARLQELAGKTYKHPFSGRPARFGMSTIERWYYKARELADPMAVLRQQVRSDRGKQPSISPSLDALIRRAHTAHRRWSFQLLYDNIKLMAGTRDDISAVPSYPTFVRFMHAQGLRRIRGRRGPLRPGEQAAIERKERREIRSYQAPYVHALWHVDFHVASRTIVGADGEVFAPALLCVTDDCSRLVCHAQWYRVECSQALVHGLCQALQKRGLPRALMSDKGKAMFASESTAGLLTLGISHDPTQAYSPHQNGKQEVFWNQVEGRLLPMLDDCADLTLEQLNDATQAWVEMEYQRRPHRELGGVAPLTRYTETRQVGRPCPDSETLRQAFTLRLSRRVRRSDGTVTLDGTRFEIPSRLRTLEQVTLRYARWDMRYVWVIDPRTDAVLARLYPLDKQANADGRRRALNPPETAAGPPLQGEMAPLLMALVRQYAATGLPPAYLAAPCEVQP